MSLILLTTLGAGDYHEATYCWKDYPPHSTKLVSAALAQWFPEAEIKVLVTPLAVKKNGALLHELLPQHQPLPIANGETEEDSWNLFQTVADAIPEDAEVIFDVTHGFRSLPVVTLLALSYLRIVKKVSLRAVVYGAWQPGQETTPIFDLTAFVALLDWAQAAEQFLRTGDARPMTTLMSTPDVESLQDLKEPLEHISASLAFQRPIQTARNAQQLRKQIAKVKKQKLQHPVMSLMLDHIEDRFSGIAHGDDAFKDRHQQVIKSQYAQLRFYVRGGQYAQAIELAYEWMRSLQMWKLGRPQGQGLWLDAKRLKPDAMAQSDFKPMELWNEFFRVQEQVRLLRNAFAHFNEYKKEFNEELADPSALAQQVEHIILSLLPAAVRPLGLELEPPTAAEAKA
ncbi:hypothetical protein GCM10017783_22860 [Deinococcus piscis]|uniref:TIGR02221 family CRISPR-associated protein n=1 Tax=Deinococcus piscis TaxID=394230 RepID=A0ABQ3KEC0_9DEIO|nr:hypothetical protein GCM10017783_22860 [Deinococcus piscis]